jgi:hypothetical protein
MSHVKVFGCFLLVLCLVMVDGGPSVTAGINHALPAGKVYYVSNGGSDSNNGSTPEAAWRTIDHVNHQTFQPGDSVLFKRGDVWRETLSVTSSGTSVAWITYGAYGTGNKPRLLGSEQALGWTLVATNIWRSSTNLGNPYKGGYSYAEVFFEGLDGNHRWGKHKNYDASFSQLTDEYDWSWNANTLYVYAPANPGARYSAVEVPQRDACIRFPGIDGVNVLPKDYVEYVAFDNLELMYAMQHGLYPGYNEIEAHGLRVTNSHIGYIGVRGGSAAYCIAAWHSDMLIQNNEIHDCGRRGISLNTYTAYTPGLTIRNVTIDHNHFYNGFHTTGPDISTLAGRGHTFTNFTISHNLIDDSDRRGEAINAGCYTSSCTSNSIYISSSGNSYSDFYIYNNIVIGSTSRAMLLVDIDRVYVYHNTVYASHPGARPYALVIFNTVSGIDMRNNLIYGTLPYNDGANDARCVMDQGASSFTVRDHNLYYQADPAQPFTGSEQGVGGWDTFMSEWDAWRTASGFETHSPHPQDPLFVDPATGDFHVRAASPAVDAGVRLPGLNDDYYGAAPDLGALEFIPSLTLHGAPADQTAYLTWSVNTALPVTTTWHIEYYTTTANLLTAVDPFSAARAYTLTGLTNYAWYTVTLRARLDATTLFSDTVRVMPTDLAVYLPLVLLKK